MPIRTTFDRIHGIRVHIVEGSPTAAEVRQALEESFTEPEFREDMAVLWDIRQAGSDLLSSRDVEGLAGWLGGHPQGAGPRKIALVVGRDVDFGMGRMFQQVLNIHSSLSLSVFRDIEEATGWLLAADPADSP